MVIVGSDTRSWALEASCLNISHHLAIDFPTSLVTREIAQLRNDILGSARQGRSWHYYHSLCMFVYSLQSVFSSAASLILFNRRTHFSTQSPQRLPRSLGIKAKGLMWFIPLPPSSPWPCFHLDLSVLFSDHTRLLALQPQGLCSSCLVPHPEMLFSQISGGHLLHFL